MWANSLVSCALECVVVALVVHQRQDEPTVLNGRSPSPTHLIHLVHDLEAEEDRAVRFFPPINRAGLQTEWRARRNPLGRRSVSGRRTAPGRPTGVIIRSRSRPGPCQSGAGPVAGR